MPKKTLILLLALPPMLALLRGDAIAASFLLLPALGLVLPGPRRARATPGRSLLLGAFPGLLLLPDLLGGNPSVPRILLGALGGLLVLGLLRAGPAWDLAARGLPRRWGLSILALGLLGWSWFAMGAIRHGADHRLGQDTAYFTQVVHRASLGESPRGDVVTALLYHPPLRHHFGAHLSPVLYALALPQRIWPGWETLALCRSLLLLAGFLLLLPFLERLWPAGPTLPLALLWLTMPPVWTQPLHAVYLLPIAIPAALALWLGIAEGGRRWILGGLLGLMLVREDATLLATAGALLVALPLRRRRLGALGLALFGALWYLLATAWIMPRFGSASGEAIQGLFADVGGPTAFLRDPALVLTRLFAPESLRAIFVPLRATGGLALLHPLSLAALPAHAVNALVAGKGFGTLDPGYHYALLPAAALGAGGIWALARRGLPDGRVRLPWFGPTPLLPLLALWLSGAAVSGMDALDPERLRGLRPTPEQAWVESVIRRLPPEWAVAAPRAWLPALATRRELYMANRLDDYPEPSPDAWLLTEDVASLALRDGTEGFYRQLLQRVAEDPALRRVESRGPWRLYLRRGLPWEAPR